MGNADITLRHLGRRNAEALASFYVAGGSFVVLGWADTQVTAVGRRLNTTLLLRARFGRMGRVVDKVADPLAALPLAPTAEAWRAMSPDERLRLLVQINEIFSDPVLQMMEGRPHNKAKIEAVDTLGLHFRALGRVVYVAEEMAVLYPGHKPFAPDVLVVVGVPECEDDRREAWVVVDEGKGLDLVIEVLHHGNRRKDLVDNVERYASLGIPEYFVYDRARQNLYGYRLPSPDASRYQRLVPQLGRHHSNVLDLDLAVQGNKLRFFDGASELFGSASRIERLEGMVESLAAKAARADHAEARADQAIAGLRDAILALAATRGLPCPDEAKRRLSSCVDLPLLQRWLLGATTASRVEEIFETAAPPPA